MADPIPFDIEVLNSRLLQMRRFLDVPTKDKQLAELEASMASETFWNNKEAAQQKVAELSRLKSVLVPFHDAEVRVSDLVTMRELIAAEEDPQRRQTEQTQWESDFHSVESAFSRLEIQALMNGPHDTSNAIFSVQAGAGGNDAADWTNLLLRLYTRWAERRGFTFEVIDATPGEEAGLRSATAIVSGENAYGFLKNEVGVHRLVRISPFNANGARQTSFASVDVIPEVEDDIEVKIEEKDLKIDTYRSSGAGGQHVNKTDSAVRITHLPTGIVVACQNERSQIKNRSTGMKILKARLYEHYERERKKALDAEFGNKSSISFGSQIRSYFFHPYKLVNDHRTGVKVTNVQAVMDGDIDELIEAQLKGVKKGDSKDEDPE
ncbi:MAG: peptide chain release factor 2 [Verrucomicrobiae bacterium]|nr:peptide chain release factor 2 [Verrucomicrobiae bacterium]